MLTCTSVDQANPADHQACLCHRADIQAATRRISANLSRRGFVAGVTASIASLGMVTRSDAQAPPSGPPRLTLFTNFRLFDGRSAALRDGLRLLVEGNRIKTVAYGNPAAPDGARIVDCGGRVIMPGLIDAHWHSLFAGLPLPTLLAGDVGLIFLAAGAEAERTLLRGFTTVRDLGGPIFALKQAIDDDLVPGPRIYPSGAMITSSGGHGDLRPLSDLPRAAGGPFVDVRQAEGSMVADSADEVRLRVREQLMQGASQIKVVGGGGVSSPRSPLDVLSFSEEELRAAVEVAEDWGTFVTVHAYPSATIRRAIAAGAKCIEHAHLMDDATAELMAEKGIWLSIQPFLGDDDSVPLTGESRIKQLQVFAGTDTAYRLAIKHQIKTAFGSDLLFSEVLARRQGTMLTHLTRWYSNAEILRMATGDNADLLGLCGLRNPYPGKVGTIEEGALADLLIVDGNPVEDVTLIARPDKSFLMIMKNGTVYKNTLA